MVNILGINISELSLIPVREKLKDFLAGGQHYLVTPNPEIILAAHQDEELFYILNKADLAIADGFGLKVAGRLYGQELPRITGADLSLELLGLASRDKLRVAVLNWRGGLSKEGEIKAALEKKYPGLDCLVIDTSRRQSIPSLAAAVRTRLSDFSPVLLFCTFGSPYQEKVIYQNLAALPSVRLAIGVGGAFDFLTGRLQRAPGSLRRLGLEWLWRLLQQPTRWRRIYNATLVFSAKVLWAKFITSRRYRPNVACLLYKEESGVRKILLVQRAGENNHWQLPQGGTDGETLAVAGARELREETGATHLETKAIFKNLHRYVFPAYRQPWRAETREHKYDYKGQKQGLYIAKFLGADSEIKIHFWDHTAWKWVEAERLPEEVHPVRRPAAKIFLEKFKSLNL